MASKSYILSNYKVSRTTYQFLHSKLIDCTDEEKKFFLHVMCSELLRLAPGEDEIVEGYDVLALSLPSITIKAEFRGPFPWKGLEAKRLIEASEYIMGSRGRKGECRYYQVKPALFQEILSHLDQQAMAPDGSPSVNLFDGLAYHVTDSVWSDQHGPTSTLMRHAVKVLHAVACPVNIDAVQHHLRRLKNGEYPPPVKEGGKLAYENDKLCAQTIFAGMKQTTGIGYYTPSYQPQDTGRIGEYGGGVQSCTKLMKEAAFLGMENVYNYDLRSSHGYVLLQELRKAGIDGTWVKNHLGEGVFEERAERLGLPKGKYKKAFFSTINGASHHWKKEDPGPIQDMLVEHLQDTHLAHAKFDEVVWQLRPLKELVKAWHKWLLSDACPYLRQSRRRGQYLVNAAGQELLLNRHTPEEPLPDNVEQGIKAHILQGQEAAYIHHLTLLSKTYAFTPLSNQHDGLITLGTVPEEAKVEAGKLSGFEEPHLEIKPYV